MLHGSAFLAYSTLFPSVTFSAIYSYCSPLPSSYLALCSNKYYTYFFYCHCHPHLFPIFFPLGEAGDQRLLLAEMGKEWYWVSGAKPSSTPKSTKKASERDLAQTNPSGCISAVFHLFDFHHFHFPLSTQTSSSSCSCFQPDSFLNSTDTTIKGAEATRKSLESEEEGSTSASASPSLISTSKEELLNIPIGIQIKTSVDTRSKVGATNNYEICSEISGSPGTKTPTLVARLMGLDLLPESRSPSFPSAPNFQSNSRLKHHYIQSPKPLQSKITDHRNLLDGDIWRTRSLPETPRISSARRSDVDHHHRLSLQINKENMTPSEESVMSRLSSLKRKELKHEDENRSPGHYARQIVKQVKQSVSRKVGMDITNIIQNREQAREELVSQFKLKKISSVLTKIADDDKSNPVKHSIPSSCSPKLRVLESKSKLVINSSTKDRNAQPPKSSFSLSSETNIQPQPIGILPKPKLQPVKEEQDAQHKPQQQQRPRAASKCKKGSSEKFSSRPKKPQQTSDIIRNKQEEPFVRPYIANRVNMPDKNCRKSPLFSNEILSITVSPLLPVKKDPSPPATKIPQKQVLDAQRPKRSSQLSSCSSQTYNKQEATHAHVSRDNNRGDRCNDSTTAGSTTGDEEEYEYIARILRRTGLGKDTPVSFPSWFSPSHPLDPSIFYYLEHFTTCSTAILSNTNDTNNNKKTKSSQLSHRCNRKLLFHLVDEILIEILKPYFNMKPWVITVGHDFGHMDGSQLIDTLCSKIKSFPRADCRVLEDIDALIDRDLPGIKLQGIMAYEEEGEGIVAEIEKDILEALLHETTVDFGIRF